MVYSDSPRTYVLHIIPFCIIRLRNPFRFALDPNAAKAEGKTRFFINDVGRHTWESVHEGGDGFAGANYGYPEREGKIPECILYSFSLVDRYSILISHTPSILPSLLGDRTLREEDR